MLNLIVILVVGAALAFISKFNLEPTTVNLGWYIFSDVPLFYVIIASLLIGLVLSYIFQLLTSISNSINLRGKRNEIKSGKKENLGLAKRIHQLEIENEHLKHGSSQPEDSNAL